MSSDMPENKGRFDELTRDEVHLLRDMIHFYRAECKTLDDEDAKLAVRLVREMHNSAHWYSDTGRAVT